MTTIRSHAGPATNAPIGDRSLLHGVARVGIASRGIIYLLLAYLAFDIARHGSAPTQTSSTGALQEVKTRPAGSALLVLLAIGLGCYGLWRILNAIGQRRDGVVWLGSVAIGVLYFWLCVQAARLISGQSAGTGSAGNPVPIVAKVLRWSGGAAMVEVAGVIVMSVGVALAIWGIFHRFEKDLALEQVRRNTQRLVKVTGGAGDVARGFLVVLVGIYLLKAGIAANPKQAKSVDESLKTLVGHPYGAVLIGLVAIGLLCFALCSFFDARLRRIT